MHEAAARQRDQTQQVLREAEEQRDNWQSLHDQAAAQRDLLQALLAEAELQRDRARQKVEDITQLSPGRGQIHWQSWPMTSPKFRSSRMYG